MKKTIPFTKKGYDELLIRRKKLLDQRPSAVLELKRAREMGDLSENGAYKGARAKLSQIDRDLRFVENLIKYGHIVENKNKDTIDIGSTVRIKTEQAVVEYTIVGGFESNPLEGTISHSSPIGKSLIGKKIGERITVLIPKGTVVYTILEII